MPFFWTFPQKQKSKKGQDVRCCGAALRGYIPFQILFCFVFLNIFFSN